MYDGELWFLGKLHSWAKLSYQSGQDGGRRDGVLSMALNLTLLWSMGDEHCHFPVKMRTTVPEDDNEQSRI